MFKNIRATIYFLISGIIVSSIGAWGSLSAEADTIKKTSQTLYFGMQSFVIFGAFLILLAVIFFIIGMVKSK